jgi:hypothetical protein
MGRGVRNDGSLVTLCSDVLRGCCYAHVLLVSTAWWNADDGLVDHNDTDTRTAQHSSTRPAR